MYLQNATNNIDENLAKMIAEEPDQVQRANLLVLNAIALNLSANTMALNALGVEVHDHKQEFKEHRQKFRDHRTLVYTMGVAVTLVVTTMVWLIHNVTSLMR